MLRQLDSAKQADDSNDRQSVASDPRSTRAGRLVDRFSASQIQRMIDSFLSGTAVHVLADQYGISASTIKRYFRANNIRVL